jgi:proline dehydrogenase
MSVLDWFVSRSLPLTPRVIVRRFSKRYIAGPRTEDALNVVRSLAEQGAMSTLDILGEFITLPEEAEAGTRAYEQLVDRISDEGLTQTHVSVKLTALGLTIDPELCLRNTRELMRHVKQAKNFLRIDMEDSPCTTKTLEIYRTLRAEFPGSVGTVLQSRLRRTLDDVDALTDEPANLRLCKGIYLEPRPIAYTDAQIIRDNFTLSLERLFERGAYVGIATHDERLVWEALRLIRRFGLTPEQYEFQMLLGIDEELRSVLLKAGHRMRVYVPFGEKWYEYSLRRLRENPQIAGHALRAVFKKH